MEILIHDCSEKYNALGNEHLHTRGFTTSWTIYIDETGRFHLGDDPVSVAFCPFCGIDLSSIEPTMRSNFNG